MTVEIEIRHDITVECANCGALVNARMGGQYSWSKDVLLVEPCEACLQEKYEDGKVDAE